MISTFFDNGAEQKINYLEEFDFSWRDTNEQWSFYPHIRGTWGDFNDADLAFAPPAATYIIGYIPPSCNRATVTRCEQWRETTT